MTLDSLIPLRRKVVGGRATPEADYDLNSWQLRVEQGKVN